MALTLDVEPREAHGRRVGALRRSGQVPGIVYGHRVDAVPVQCGSREFDRLYQRAGRAHLLQLRIAGERTRRPVLIREVQINPRHATVVHVDFLQVNLLERLVVDVPVVLVGESAATRLGTGEVLHALHSLAVTCLPTAIPGQIDVDVSALAAVDDEIRLSALTLPDGAELGPGIDPEELVVKILASRVAEADEPAAAAAPLAGAAEPGADAPQGTASSD